MKHSRRGRLKRFVDVCVIILIVAAAGVTVQRVMPTERTRPAQVEIDLMGHTVGEIEVWAIGDPSTQTLSFADGNVRVLCLYLEECDACDRQKTMWRALADELPSDVLVEAVSLSGRKVGAPYVNHARIREWIAVSPAQFRAVIPTTSVPATLVIGSDGGIRFARLGTTGDGVAALIMRIVEEYGSPATAEPPTQAQPSL